MIFESESPPSWLQDLRRFCFWLTVSLLIHAGWLYLLQASLPIQTPPPNNNATLYLMPELAQTTSPPLLYFTPPASPESDIRILFETAKQPATASGP